MTEFIVSYLKNQHVIKYVIGTPNVIASTAGFGRLSLKSDLFRSGGIYPSGNGNRIERSSPYPSDCRGCMAIFDSLFIPVCALAVTTRPVIGRLNIL